MAALGWLMNLDFAASAVTVVSVGTFTPVLRRTTTADGTQLRRTTTADGTQLRRVSTAEPTELRRTSE